MQRLSPYGILLTFCLILCPVWSDMGWAQGVQKSASNPSATRKTAAGTTAKNVRTGVIAAMDTESITLRSASGATTPYVLTEKTVFRKNRAECAASEFHPGDDVVIKLRKVRGKEEYVVQEVNDPISWNWVSDLRKKTVQATITGIAEDSLSVTIGPDAVPATYTTSDKTRWSRGNREATSEDFKPGDRVTIVPRALPGGNIMASIVADSDAGAALTKERYARSVNGTLQAIDAPARKMTVITPLKDVRVFAYNELTEVRIGSKKVPLAALRVGQKVRVSLKKEEGTEETAYRITIESRVATTGRKPGVTDAGSERAGVMMQGVRPRKP